MIFGDKRIEMWICKEMLLSDVLFITFALDHKLFYKFYLTIFNSIAESIIETLNRHIPSKMKERRKSF